MKLVYTDQAIVSLQNCLDFLLCDISVEKVNEIGLKIIDRADTLLQNPYLGQIEPMLTHLGQAHRRIIEGNYKIIYRIEGEIIFVINIFDSRQNPSTIKI